MKALPRRLADASALGGDMTAAGSAVALVARTPVMATPAAATPAAGILGAAVIGFAVEEAGDS